MSSWDYVSIGLVRRLDVLFIQVADFFLAGPMITPPFPVNFLPRHISASTKVPNAAVGLLPYTHYACISLCIQDVALLS